MTDAFADTAARDLTRALRHLAQVAPHGSFVESQPGLGLLRSGSSLPTLNGIVSWVRTPDPAAVATLAEEAAAIGTPWSIQLRRAPSPLVLGVASGHGLTRDRDVDLLVLGDLSRHNAEPPARGGLRIHTVDPDDSRRRRDWSQTLAAGFGLPAAAFGDLASREVLADAEFTAYLGELDGEPVATGFSAVEGGALGVFSVATRPEQRGRGIARDILTRILFDGFVRGATHAYLQAPDGSTTLYREFGFERAESWSYLLGAD